MRTVIKMTTPKLMELKEKVENEYSSGQLTDYQYKSMLREIEDRETELLKLDNDLSLQGWIRQNIADSKNVVMTTKQAKKLRHDAFQVFAKHIHPSFLFPTADGLKKDDRSGVIAVVVGLTGALKSLTDDDKDHLFIYSES